MKEKNDAINKVFRTDLWKGVFFLCGILMVCLMTSFGVRANQVKEERHLIQTTNYQDEYEGLLHLDLSRIHPFEEPDIDRVYEMIAPAIVRITMGDYAGSGIVIGLSSDKVTILSNKHLLQNAGEGTVTFSQGFEVKGTVGTFSMEYDMALLEVETSDIPYEELCNLRYVSLKNVKYQNGIMYLNKQNVNNNLESNEENGNDITENYMIMTGDPVVLIGSAQKVAGNCEMGTVTNPSIFELDFYTEMTEIEAKAVPGMSGGVVCDAYGQMVGMITGNQISDEECTYSLPIQTISRELGNMNGINE